MWVYDSVCYCLVGSSVSCLLIFQWAHILYESRSMVSNNNLLLAFTSSEIICSYAHIVYKWMNTRDNLHMDRCVYVHINIYIYVQIHKIRCVCRLPYIIMCPSVYLLGAGWIIYRDIDPKYWKGDCLFTYYLFIENVSIMLFFSLKILWF